MTPDPFSSHPESIARQINDRQRLLRNEAEDYLREEILNYEPRRRKYWSRNYESVDGFLESVAPNRERFKQAVGDYDAIDAELQPHLEPWAETENWTAWWLTLNLVGSLRGRAILALPKKTDGPTPLVIAQHGIGSSPEKVFGLDDPSDTYKSYGKKLVEEGFAVVVPMNVSGAKPRARLERLCKLMGKTLWGLEIARTSRLLDYLCERPEIDADRIGMYGISLGGAYTMFTLPLEQRIKAGVVCAWFNHRRNKMAVDDPRYSCFLSVDEEHIWIPGWLREFTDSDLVSLICPRPLLIEQGKADGIAWWPQILQEFEDARHHYRELGVIDRLKIDLHEGGHEIRLERSLSFLKQWLMD
jgi:dienelactone hydrolase